MKQPEYQRRPDAVPKVTGSLKYLTDRFEENMLIGKVLRSEYPHARIKRIDTSAAEALPGVHAVLTHHDVPGLNRFGIVMPDQPVFCEDRVRYTGDAVAAVAAESAESADQALAAVVVEYEPLPVLDSVEKALTPEAEQLHENGNILHEASYTRGDLQQGFAGCTCIVEETYQLPRQMHGYMETEGGVVVPESDGGISVYMATQHGFKDRFQLSRILETPEEKIRIISSPIGGSFGGKDELNLQPYGALLALKTGRPVRVHNTREESIRAGLKRHPMAITMRTGADESGRVLAHETTIYADTGAYATLGPAILEFAVEHASGLYPIPNITTTGVSVFTNNGVAGEFRGFGGNQVTFALEGQMDRLAEKLGMEGTKLRARNMRKPSDTGPLGQGIAPTDGGRMILEDVTTWQQLPLSNAGETAWVKNGRGGAVSMHGGGLGYGRLDPSGGRLALTKEGKLEAAFGFEECGQGIVAVIETVMKGTFSCNEEDIEITIGDTNKVPVSGSTTASRGTSMVWTAVENMKASFRRQLLIEASRVTGTAAADLYLGAGGVHKRGAEPSLFLSYKALAEYVQDGDIETHTSFDFPVTPDEIDSGHYLYSFGGVSAEVEVNLLTGTVRVLDLKQSVSAGPVMYPQGYRGQIEGGGIMALGYTLMEDAVMQEGRYQTENFDTYLMPGVKDLPDNVTVKPREEVMEGDIHGPRGVGEIGTIAVAPAIAEAIYQAIGARPEKLPVSREWVLQQIQQRGLLPWNKPEKIPGG
ncbi:xanthine dehydrogenase, molybdenum binding subunit apoprotein [Marinococcus luteus]|uniref:Xanthine dehydrogenase, molybdenum binding subunit apoprotein n=1 Tax=Marinococcus luteus TaxID=1122204 RepID=A0A1H2TC01_9BACI|nr:xanthine dehydrogenase subunit D [Marinococcus luteus]SDW41388.1 xanthine dehydrogenase, molybdenum binding subunit apoprotein [Marinococcus luteus]